MTEETLYTVRVKFANRVKMKEFTGVTKYYVYDNETLFELGWENGREVTISLANVEYIEISPTQAE